VIWDFFRVPVVVDDGQRGGGRKLGSAVEHRLNLGLGLEGVNTYS
jgi:hypothetical protein